MLINAFYVLLQCCQISWQPAQCSDAHWSWSAAGKGRHSNYTSVVPRSSQHLSAAKV